MFSFAKRAIWTASFLTFIFTWQSLLLANPPQNLSRQQTQLYTFAARHNIPCYVRNMGNGTNRVCLNVSGYQALQAIQQYMTPQRNILQICHIDPRRVSHTLAIFDGGGPHFQTPDGFRSWRCNDWLYGRGLRPSSNPVVSALIKLDANAASNLRREIKLARREQAAHRVIQTAFGLNRRGGNCTSIWSGAAIGTNGETLSQICGLGGYPNGSPHSFQGELEERGNNNVIGMIVYGPKIPNFGAQPNVGLWQKLSRDGHF